MNYIHHAFIGVGTASLGLLAAQAVGAPHLPAAALGLTALAVTAGSIATDLDHPRSFISNTIPTSVLRFTLAILALPVLAALCALLTTLDFGGTLTSFSGMIWGIAFLRQTAIALGASLGLMLLSLILYKSLHHRGPLHSLVFTASLTTLACLLLALYHQPWGLGLAFGWGWLWHLLADGLTEQGVPFYWPFNDSRHHTLPRWACGLGRVILTPLAITGIIALVGERLLPYLLPTP